MEKSIKNFGELNVKVDLNDVVNVFVSKYEKELLERKKELNEKIRVLKEVIGNELKKVKGKYNEIIKKEFDKDFNWRVKNDLFGCNYEGGDFVNERKEFVGVIELSKVGGGFRDIIDFEKKVNVDLEDLKELEKLESELRENKKEMGEVMMLISGISSKEREVRGLISEKNLRENGMEKLLGDVDVLKVIELK